MSKKRRRPEKEETSYWLSYSDMMAALLLIFILIISFTLMQSKSQYESKQAELDKQKEIIKEQEQLLKDQQDELDRITGIRSDLVAALLHRLFFYLSMTHRFEVLPRSLQHLLNDHVAYCLEFLLLTQR